MRQSTQKTGRKRTAPQKGSAVERRVPTPRADLVVLRLGQTAAKRRVSPSSPKASALIKKIVARTSTPGLKRRTVFSSKVGKPVFAYSVSPRDPSMLIQEDHTGKKTVGRFVNGTFRPISS
jgi:hypothetical protein